MFNREKQVIDLASIKNHLLLLNKAGKDSNIYFYQDRIYRFDSKSDSVAWCSTRGFMVETPFSISVEDWKKFRDMVNQFGNSEEVATMQISDHSVTFEGEGWSRTFDALKEDAMDPSLLPSNVCSPYATKMIDCVDDIVLSEASKFVDKNSTSLYREIMMVAWRVNNSASFRLQILATNKYMLFYYVTNVYHMLKDNKKFFVHPRAALMARKMGKPNWLSICVDRGKVTLNTGTNGEKGRGSVQSEKSRLKTIPNPNKIVRGYRKNFASSNSLLIHLSLKDIKDLRSITKSILAVQRPFNSSEEALTTLWNFEKNADGDGWNTSLAYVDGHYPKDLADRVRSKTMWINCENEGIEHRVVALNVRYLHQIFSSLVALKPDAVLLNVPDSCLPIGFDIDTRQGKRLEMFLCPRAYQKQNLEEIYQSIQAKQI